MYVVGLTGGIASGKTSVSNLFAKLGIDIIDTDQIARDVVAPGKVGLQKIVNHFGSSFLTDNGELNRRQLRECIFKNPEQKVQLEKILHPLIFEEMKKQINNSQSSYCLAVIPLLVETNSQALLDRILVIDVPEAIQLERAKARDKYSEKHIQAIIDSQTQRKKRLSYADDIILNDSSLENLKSQVTELHKKYLTLSRPQ